MDMIHHQMPLLDPAFLLRCEIAKNLSEILPQIRVERFPPALGYEDYVVFAVPSRMA